MGKKLEEQNEHARRAHENERNAWAKRFGDGKLPGDDPNHPAIAEAQKAAEMAMQAQACEMQAKKAEADAFKLDMLIKAIERAMELEEKLRPEICCCGHRFAED